MKTPSIRIVVATMAALLLLAACGGTSGSTWTIAPVQPTATPGPSTAASVAPSGAPTTAPSADASGEPASPGASTEASAAAGQTITLEVTGALQITQDGQPVTTLAVREGETVHFVLDNTAGFPHNFFIGTPDQLSQNQVAGLPGIPDWSSGVQEFDYVVTAETAGLEFACTVPGHYGPMHGTFTVAP